MKLRWGARMNQISPEDQKMIQPSVDYMAMLFEQRFGRKPNLQEFQTIIVKVIEMLSPGAKVEFIHEV